MLSSLGKNKPAKQKFFNTNVVHIRDKTKTTYFYLRFLWRKINKDNLHVSSYFFSNSV